MLSFCVHKAIAAKVPRTEFNVAMLARAIKDAIWELPLPIVVLGGIYSGYFAVSEAAAITAIYVLLVEVVIYRDIKWRELPQIMRKSMVLVGGILIILGAALGLTNYLIDEEIPMKTFDFFKAYTVSPFLFRVLLNLFLLVVGCIMGMFLCSDRCRSSYHSRSPCLRDHPIHLGIIFLTNLQIGALTPPVGMSLFIQASVLKNHY